MRAKIRREPGCHILRGSRPYRGPGDASTRMPAADKDEKGGMTAHQYWFTAVPRTPRVGKKDRCKPEERRQAGLVVVVRPSFTNKEALGLLGKDGRGVTRLNSYSSGLNYRS